MDTYEFTLIHNKKPVKFTGTSLRAVSVKVKSFLSNNGDDTDLATIENKVANQIKFAPLRNKKRSIPKLTEAYHASLALFRFAGGKTVDQKELDRRTRICLDCPLRAKSTFCAGCGGLGKATHMLNEARRLTKQSLKFNAKLSTQFCGVCGCSLPLLLSTDKEFLPEDDVLQKKLRPETCWMNTK